MTNLIFGPLLVSLALLSTSTKAHAGFFDFLSDIFDSSSSTRSTNPQPLVYESLSPDSKPLALSPPKVTGGYEDGVLVPADDVASVKLPQFNDNCRKVVNQRPVSRTSDAPEVGIFIPTNSAQEWNQFKAHPPPRVTLGTCQRTISYKIPGACRHIQNENYENRDVNPAYLMSCTRKVSLSSIPDGPETGERISKITMAAPIGALPFNQRGNILSTSGSNTLCQPGTGPAQTADLTVTSSFHTTTNTVESGTSLETETNYSNGAKQRYSLRKKYVGNSGIKYDERIYVYDEASNSVSITHNMNGWGDCREDTCATCVGDITLSLTIE